MELDYFDSCECNKVELIISLQLKDSFQVRTSLKSRIPKETTFIKNYMYLKGDIFHNRTFHLESVSKCHQGEVCDSIFHPKSRFLSFITKLNYDRTKSVERFPHLLDRMQFSFLNLLKSKPFILWGLKKNNSSCLTNLKG